MFQFQYGTIKRERFFDRRNFFDVFQFQYGTIKRIIAIQEVETTASFNSNMVRLKVQSVKHDAAVNSMFQFQYGMIKSMVFL